MIRTMLILIAVALNSCVWGYSGTTGTVNAEAKTIEQFGITWTLDKTPVSADPNYVTDYLYGNFANGDFWVYDEDGTVTVSAITPAKAEVAQDDRTFIMDGSMVDPVDLGTGPNATGTKQGFDQRIAAYWDESVSVSAPVVLTGTSSLISCDSWRLGESGCPSRYSSTPGSYMYYMLRPSLKTSAILTSVSAIPTTGSFRPAYCGTTTKVVHAAAELDLSILETATTTLGTVANVPDLSVTATWTTWSNYLLRPWLDFPCSWSGEIVHPSEAMPNYGRQMASRINDVALLLLMDSDCITSEQKTTLAKQMIQIGIDNYGIIANGGGWGHIGGGIGQGRKLPILFAGAALDYADYKNIGTTHGYHATASLCHLYFQEDAQKFYTAQADIDRYGTTSKRVTRSNCSVDAATPKTITDDDSGTWYIADDGSSVIQSRSLYENYDYWLVWNYGSTYEEYSRITSVNGSSMNLREAVTPGTGRTARVQLYPQGRLGLPDWAGGGSQDHWTLPTYDWYSRNYRHCCTGNSLAGAQLFALAVKTRDDAYTLKDLWEWDAFFDYMDYYMQEYHSDPTQRSWTTFAANFWDTHRATLGSIWSVPKIAPIGDKEAIEGETVAFTVMDNDGYGTGTTDINGDALVFALVEPLADPNMAINASTGAFSWNTEDDNDSDVGTHTVVFSVENDAGRKTYQGITITIASGTPPGPAVDPVLGHVGNVTLVLGVAAEVDVVDATDENGGDLTYSAQRLPTGLSINGTTGAITGTPTNPGKWKNVRILVTDPTGRTDHEDITIEVYDGTHKASFFK